MRVSGPESGGLGGAGGRLAVVVGVVLLAMSLLPSGVTGWVTVFRGPLQTVIGPVSGPLRAVAGAVRPAVRVGEGAEGGLEDILRQRDRYELLLRQANRRIGVLEERLELLEGWRDSVDRAVTARFAGVIGRELGAGTVTVRVRGSGEIPLGTVAVDSTSRQLVGRVAVVGPSALTVRLITARGVEGPGRWMRCAVFPESGVVEGVEAQAGLPRVDLELGGGAGFVSAAAATSDGLAVGAAVRLDDPSWPEEAQMLLVGRVVEVLDSGTPLMSEVRVEPTVDDLGALTTLVLLVPGESGSGEGGGGG